MIELMIVVAIIGILAAIAIPKFADLVKKSQEGKIRGNLTAVRSALSIYYGDNEGIYPVDNGLMQMPSLTLNAKYLKSFPSIAVPGFEFAGHGETALARSSKRFYTDPGSEGGTWGYVNNNGNENWGYFWVYCIHNDSKGTDWQDR